MSSNSFVDSVLQEQRDRRSKCNLSKILNTVSHKEREEIIEAICDPRLTAAAIARVLSRKYIPISEWGVRRCKHSCDCGLLKSREDVS